ncbi:MAG: branched-chain amino acid aminotransferase [Bacteroidota bacterium]
MELIRDSIKTQRVEKSRFDTVDMSQIPFGRVFSDHMLMARYENGSWGAPEIVPYDKLSLAPSVCTLHYGQAIFEGMKALKGIDGQPCLFRPIDNFLRLNRSAYRMGMPALPERVFMEGIRSLVSLDRAWVPSLAQGSLYIRPFMFATDEYIGVRSSDSYLFITFTCPVGGYYNKPVSLLTSKEFVRAAQGGTGSAKCAGNYAASLLPDKLAKSQGYDNILWLDAKEHTYVEECGTMNVFFVIDGTVITSPLTGTILPGITRDSVIRLLKDNGYKVEVRPISIYEVESAYEQGTLTEAFGAGTAATIAKIDRIGYAGRDLTFPPYGKESISSWLLDTLQAIKTGEKDDPYGWVVAV